MKKYLILAAATLAAMCACTKNEAYDAPQQSINFNVASYMPQTKSNASILPETETFKSFAFYHVNGTTQAYFGTTGETINWDATNKQWAPSKTYYWPKTGYINFYSYYGTKAPVVTDGSLTYGTETAPLTIAATDNLVFADPAFNQNANLATYLKDGVTEGVPTLFHHALAQIAFDAAVTKVNDKESEDDTEYTTWEVTIDEASLIVNNKGTLALSATLPAETEAASNPAWLTSYDVVGWTPATTASTETIALNKLATTTALTTTAASILDARSIMPQTLDTDNAFSIKFTIKTIRSWDADNPVSEQITVTKNIKDFEATTALTSWNMNKKYIYHIIINPSDTKKILFDPAVEEMVTVDPAGTLNYPPTPATTE